MKESLLNLIACPDCLGDLALESKNIVRESEEILSGELCCPGCGKRYPIREGVPRFADLGKDEAQRETAENFGAQWLEFDHVEAHHHQQFLDWLSPVTADFMKGKVILEGGCGKGRHTRLIGEWGAKAVIGADLSVAVEAAFRNTRDLPNVHIIQADIYNLPLKQCFDYAFSVGVLHHLPDPRAGFLSLAGKLKAGGAISAWVYGEENNEWIVNFVNPVRKYFTSKLPPKVLYYLSYFPTIVLFLILKLCYLPLKKTEISQKLFYADYLNYIAPFPFREIHNIVHDHLTAPVAFYINRADFSEWFEATGAERPEINWHNRNSWRGFALIRPETENGK